MRHIVLDTETTGLSSTHDRIIEIACLELENFVTTGRYFQAYVNPQQPVSPDAQAVHGLSNDFLEKHPPFAHIAADVLKFIDDAPLVIHNAPFDMAFLHEEFKRLGQKLPEYKVIDTLPMARKKFPGSPANLNALCRRFNISLEERDKHGALIDCELLARVYLELLGGPQRLFSFSEQKSSTSAESLYPKTTLPHRIFPLSKEDKERHNAMRSSLPGSTWDNIDDESN